jgi:hypothetical protein
VLLHWNLQLHKSEPGLRTRQCKYDVLNFDPFPRLGCHSSTFELTLSRFMRCLCGFRGVGPQWTTRQRAYTRPHRVEGPASYTRHRAPNTRDCHSSTFQLTRCGPRRHSNNQRKNKLNEGSQCVSMQNDAASDICDGPPRGINLPPLVIESMPRDEVGARHAVPFSSHLRPLNPEP